MNKKIRSIVLAAVIAAMYTVLTLMPGISLISFGPLQVRIAEAMCIFVYFTSAAIPGLTIGCVLSNGLGLALGLNPIGSIDMFVGSAATLIAALIAYRFDRKWLVPLPAVLLNAAAVGLELTFLFTEGGATVPAFWLNFLSVGAGQLIACYGLGLPLLYLLQAKGNRVWMERCGLSHIPRKKRI